MKRPAWLDMLVALVAGAALAHSAHALECPAMPQQVQRDWDTAVALAIGKLGSASGPQLEAQTRSTTTDLLKKLPGADRVYLEQMMYATYCSSLRDTTGLSEAERNRRIQAYNRELRATLNGTAAAGGAAKPPVADPRDAARAELARLPMPYTPEAFVEAASKGRMDLLQLFLRAGIDPNATDSRTATALMHAAGRGDLPMMALLLKNRAAVDARMQDRSGATALAWAAAGGQVPAMRLLLNSGAAKDTLNDALRPALRKAQLDVIAVLLQAGANVRADDGDTAGLLVSAAQTAPQQAPALLRLLLQQGWPVDARDGNNMTTLMQAAYEQNILLMGSLLQAGADVNATCDCSGILEGGHSALTLAAQGRNDSVAAMRLLLDAGAAVNHTSATGSALTVAASQGNLEAAALLLARGADASKGRGAGGETAVMQWAKTGGRPELLALLLKGGADVNAATGSGSTALMWAAQLDADVAAQQLLDAGARIDLTTRRGRTALMVAALNGSFDTVRLLIARGARMDLIDEDNRSALALAESALKGDDLARMRSLLNRQGGTK